MNENTFRILVGKTATRNTTIDPSYVEELNKNLSELKFGNITFEKVGKSGSVQVGRPVNLSGAVNIITADPGAVETENFFGDSIAERAGRAAHSPVTGPKFQKFLRAEDLVDKISTTAKSQLYITPSLITTYVPQEIYSGINRNAPPDSIRAYEAMHEMRISLSVPFHEIGHAASHQAGIPRGHSLLGSGKNLSKSIADSVGGNPNLRWFPKIH